VTLINFLETFIKGFKTYIRREFAVFTTMGLVMLKIPILYIGTGEGIDDMVPFDARMFVEELSS
jgi:hypothetical protein